MVTMVSFRDERAAHRYGRPGLAASWGNVSTMPRADQRPVTVGPTVDSSDAVDLTVPADPIYLAVVRTATAGLATRLQLTLDEIEDLRIAVDEACSLLLAGRAHPGRTLQASFTLRPGTISVLICGPATDLPEGAGFSWSVLKALAGEVLTGVDEQGSWIRLTHTGRETP
jgi:serine/threonine-protein kinase RsbW